MTEQQQQVELTAEEIQEIKETAEAELKRLGALDKLEEVDFLKLRLLNRNVDMFEMQIELSKSRLKEAFQFLQEFGNNLMQRYGLGDMRQINPDTGEVTRNPAELPTGEPNAR